MVNYFVDYNAKSKKKCKSGGSAFAESVDNYLIEDYIDMMRKVYSDRLKMYNKGDLTGEKPSRLKPRTSLSFNGDDKRAIIKASEDYDINTVKNSFIAFADTIIKGDEYIDYPISYFLKYNDNKEGFQVIGQYLNTFNSQYSSASD